MHSKNYPWFKRIDSPCLVSGYCRGYFKSLADSMRIPDTTVDLILQYYPRFNGTSFTWLIKDNCITDTISDWANRMQTLSDVYDNEEDHLDLSFDSDVFDVGLPNKFFLRLCANAGGDTKTTYHHKCQRERERYNRSRRGGYYSGRDRCGGHVGYQSMQDYDEDDADTLKQRQFSKENLKFVIKLISFPLQYNHYSALFHAELYLHCINNNYNYTSNNNNNNNNTINGIGINTNSHNYSNSINIKNDSVRRLEHSTIWKISRRQYDYGDEDESFSMFNWCAGGTMDILKFFQGESNKSEINRGDVSFIIECNLKVLRVGFADCPTFVTHNDADTPMCDPKRQRDRPEQGTLDYYNETKYNNVTKYWQNTMFKSKFRFSWALCDHFFEKNVDSKSASKNMQNRKNSGNNIQNDEKKDVDSTEMKKSSNSNNDSDGDDGDNDDVKHVDSENETDRDSGGKRIIEEVWPRTMHSGVFSDVFQLQGDTNGQFSLMICGLPFKTHKMGIKCNLFVCYGSSINASNIINKENVASIMTTFDFDTSTKYWFSAMTNKKINQLLDKYKRITLMCDIKIIQRYDAYQYFLDMDYIEQMVKNDNANNQNDNNDGNDTQSETESEEEDDDEDDEDEDGGDNENHNENDGNDGDDDGNDNENENENHENDDNKENSNNNNNNKKKKKKKKKNNNGKNNTININDNKVHNLKIEYPNLNQEIELSRDKILTDNLPSDSFIWCVKKDELEFAISQLRCPNDYLFHSQLICSPVFSLLNARFYLSIDKWDCDEMGNKLSVDDEDDENVDISKKHSFIIRANCLIPDEGKFNDKNNNRDKNSDNNSDSGDEEDDNGNDNHNKNNKKSYTYWTKLAIIETGRHNESVGVQSSGGKGQWGFVIQSVETIKEMNLDELKIRFNLLCMTRDKDKLKDKAKDKIKDNDEQKDKNDKHDDDKTAVLFKDWLVDTVKLPQYLNKFKKEALMDLEIVQLLSNDDLIAIGVNKIGHRLKIMKHVKNLPNI